MPSTPAAYAIDHKGLSLDIAIVEAEKILIHKEIIPHRLERLKKMVYTFSQISRYLLIC